MPKYRVTLTASKDFRAEVVVVADDEVEAAAFAEMNDVPDGDWESGGWYGFEVAAVTKLDASGADEA